MKYLSDYIQEAQSAALDKYGAFFAFGKDQFDEKAVDGVQYVQTNMGMIVPKENVQALFDELLRIHEEGRAQDVAENGIEGIIRRELSNHECYYTGDISDAVDSLEAYGITRDQVSAIFRGDGLVCDNCGTSEAKYAMSECPTCGYIGAKVSL